VNRLQNGIFNYQKQQKNGPEVFHRVVNRLQNGIFNYQKQPDVHDTDTWCSCE